MYLNYKQMIYQYMQLFFQKIFSLEIRVPTCNIKIKKNNIPSREKYPKEILFMYYLCGAHRSYNKNKIRNCFRYKYTLCTLVFKTVTE